MSPSITPLVVSLELTFALAGAGLLWRFFLSPAARAHRRATPPRLGAWEVSLPEFLLFALFVIAGSLAGAIGAGLVGKFFAVRGDAATIIAGAAAQFGMLAGVALYRMRAEKSAPPPAGAGPGAIASGAVTFFVCLVPLIIASKLWELLLETCKLPVDRQDLIGMFGRAESPWLLAVMITLAVVVAPLTEELVFRAGLFRWLRTRVPRWAALLLPALFFASLHVNWSTLRGLSSLVPLTLLAVIFSLAYERTGRIGTPIVAHALFNLNTVLVVLSGVPV